MRNCITYYQNIKRSHVQSGSEAKNSTIELNKTTSSQELSKHNKDGKAMSKKINEFPPAETIGERWANFLHTHYKMRHAAKCIARDFNCEPRTAKAWLAGQAPHLSKIHLAGRLHGISAAAEILFPDTTYSKREALKADVVDLKNKIEVLNERVRELVNNETIIPDGAQ